MNASRQQDITWTVEYEQSLKTILRRTLRPWQIFSIVISGTIGIGFIQNTSYALRVAGPGGAFLAVALVGVVVISVMECICEMLSVWPIPNAMVEFVSAFVDEELAIVIGVSYWIMQMLMYSALVTSAVSLCGYWHLSTSWRAVLHVTVPLVLIAINFRPAHIFGMFNVLVGLTKSGFLVVLFILMILRNNGWGDGNSIGSHFFNEGIEHDPEAADGRFAAVCIAISMSAFSYLGLETVMTTAFEVRQPRDLQFTLKNTPLLVWIIYAVLTLLFTLNVPWNDPELPRYSNQGLGGLIQDRGVNSTSPSLVAPIVALRRADLNVDVLNAFFVFTALSAANVALYSASRTLFGLARSTTLLSFTQSLPANRNWLQKIHKQFEIALGTVGKRTSVPWRAVLLSAVMFCWLPFVGLKRTNSTFEFQQTLLNLGSVNGIVIWGSQCLAYIRYRYYLQKHQERLIDFYSQFLPSRRTNYFTYFQPALAYLGLLSCLLVVVGFNSASLWNGKEIGLKFAGAYISPIVGSVLWIVLKACRGKRLTLQFQLSSWNDFRKQLHRLTDLVYPTDYPTSAESKEPPDTHNKVRGARIDDMILTRPNLRTIPHRSTSGDDQGPPGDFVRVANGHLHELPYDLHPCSTQMSHTDMSFDTGTQEKMSLDETPPLSTVSEVLVQDFTRKELKRPHSDIAVERVEMDSDPSVLRKPSADI
ncbi:hypothetical protein EPUS_02655 [Endocarpon pusillum Z07020]|uniref:Amino acid permease/ SLC12A domain-containing protein n=1 Tax=Endocarpon pusillum (strain Z07020 / HMAS-L-300199) TaxID=1263415 RepID=U1GWS0_ENDPU|nr:uncharacterized protein EPUS_02655 [Endocarpon pusillum Z07020]ERF76943.1 hypothetical protein EPUS_02655 [Endocarpon pusillum Z07020]